MAKVNDEPFSINDAEEAGRQFFHKPKATHAAQSKSPWNQGFSQATLHKPPSGEPTKKRQKCSKEPEPQIVVDLFGCSKLSEYDNVRLKKRKGAAGLILCWAKLFIRWRKAEAKADNIGFTRREVLAECKRLVRRERLPTDKDENWDKVLNITTEDFQPELETFLVDFERKLDEYEATQK